MQSAFKSEVYALTLLLRAVLRITPPRDPTHCVVAVDCQAALALANGGGNDLQAFALEMSDCIQRLHPHWRFQLCWVPSHGKQSSRFVAPPICNPEQLRALNARADEAAKRAVQRRCAISARPAWVRESELALQWEPRVLAAASRVAEAYASFAATLT